MAVQQFYLKWRARFSLGTAAQCIRQQFLLVQRMSVILVGGEPHGRLNCVSILQANKPVDTSQQFDLLRLQTQAFEAINELVRSASNETLPLVAHLVPVVLQRLAATMSAGNAHGSENPGDLQVTFLQATSSCSEPVLNCLSCMEKVGAGSKQLLSPPMHMILPLPCAMYAESLHRKGCISMCVALAGNKKPPENLLDCVILLLERVHRLSVSPAAPGQLLKPCVNMSCGWRADICLCLVLKTSLLQGLLCGVLQVIIQKLAEQEATRMTVVQYADQIMEALLSVFSNRHATVHEEAMLAVGALTYACGPQFSKYMQSFYPILEVGLQQHLVGAAPLNAPLKVCAGQLLALAMGGGPQVV